MARDSSKQRHLVSRQRLKSTIAVNPLVLIVCEGEATEVNYFREIFQEFRVNKRTYSCIHAEGTQPLKVVNSAIKHCGKNSDWEYVFCVFDRDDHPGYDQAIKKAQNQVLKNATGKQIEFKVIPSNPCFELWLLLHYQEQNREDRRDIIVSKLEKHLKDYEKGGAGLFTQTKADWQLAASRAEQLPGRDDHTNPSTRVDELVKRLHSLYQEKNESRSGNGQ
ncbi:MAG: RloB family protein [Alphaproteobacteria bacterium]|nr:RloB family protein [Alphaproteobacteria bacterium]